MTIEQNKARGYDLVLEIGKLQAEYNQKVQPLQEELKTLNTEIEAENK